MRNWCCLHEKFKKSQILKARGNISPLQPIVWASPVLGRAPKLLFSNRPVICLTDSFSSFRFDSVEGVRECKFPVLDWFIERAPYPPDYVDLLELYDDRDHPYWTCKVQDTEPPVRCMAPFYANGKAMALTLKVCFALKSRPKCSSLLAGCN